MGNELLLFQKATSLVLGGWLEINYSLAWFITGFGMLDLQASLVPFLAFFDLPTIRQAQVFTQLDSECLLITTIRRFSSIGKLLPLGMFRQQCFAICTTTILFVEMSEVRQVFFITTCLEFLLLPTSLEFVLPHLGTSNCHIQGLQFATFRVPFCPRRGLLVCALKVSASFLVQSCIFE